MASTPSVGTPQDTGARSAGAATPSTPEGAAKALIATGDPKLVMAFLAQVPAARLSTSAVQVVNALAANPAALKKLSDSPDASPAMLRALGTQPYDPGVGTAINTFLASKTGASAPAPAPAAARPGGWSNPGPARVFEGRPSYPSGASMPEGQAQALFPKTYASEMKEGKVRTEGGSWGSGRKIAVQCDYEVAVRNPKTGEVERVLFVAVEQKRAVPFGMGAWYDTRDDVDSKVLACEGHQYGPKELKYNMSGKGPAEQWVSGNVTDTAAFSYDAIPELKQRVEHYQRTGETGNEAARATRK